MNPAQTILLVEDTRSDAMLYAALLKRAQHASRRVDFAPTLGAALQMLATSPYDAVLLDLGLPDCRGLEGVERIVGRYPGVPVIVLTGNDEAGIGDQAIAAGAQDYLRKAEARADTLERSLRYASVRQRNENEERESRQELRALFDRNPAPVFVYDEHTLALLAVNEAALEFYGYSREAMLALSALDVRAPEEHDAFIDELRAAPGDRRDPRDCRHVTADGRALSVQVHTDRIRFQGRDCRIAIVLDVTAQREAQQRLAESEQRYRAVFEQSLGCFCTHDLDGVLIALNPAAAAALGRDAAEMIGHRLSEYLPSGAQQPFAEYLARIRAHGEDRGLITPLHRSGAPRTWIYHNRLFRAAGQPPIVLAYAQDITEQRRTEQALRARTAEMAAINDAAPLGLFHTDVAGMCTYVNRTFERLSGLDGAQALGHGWAAAVHPDDRERVHAEWVKAAGSEEGRYSGEHRFLHADGRVVTVQVRAARVTVDGAHTGFVGTVQDITREREAQAATRRGQRRLATLADALPLLLMFLDRNGRVEFANRGWLEELQRPATQIVGSPLVELIREPATPYFVEGIYRALEGEQHEVELEDPHGAVLRTWHAVFIPQHDHRGRVDGVHVMLRDVTLERARQRELADRADRDPLTGLLNRSGFDIRAQRCWQAAAAAQQPVAAFFVDLDDFKAVNDDLGHAVGDALLVDVAAALDEALRDDDLLARMGGDEFAVVAVQVADDAAAGRVAAKLIEAVSAVTARYATSSGGQASCSVGYHVADPARIQLSAALKRADEALYIAKRAGKRCASPWPGGARV
ncbi:PAS domain S-box protein [Luteimonas sp. RD2P54]|uniref:PAS domain S-box protein n=1 Tax=Luteimonas endophytica TaxID=3042023 RepID=A0ABT6J8Z8_9GAMM|nr:PAS domain S-box protein [Luteimonas endophytica]MDH5823085.1 PAS domain S-box protein [Luteimonas endophytica]